jgi:preprotein translocase subunit SecG
MTTVLRVLLGSTLVLTSLFLILLVLVQRGRGGGLAGALGGMGGQSAFGTKAGDMFTRITVGVAGFWIVLCILATNMLGRQRSLLSGDLGGAAPQAIAPAASAPQQPGSGSAAVPGAQQTAPGADASGAAAPAEPAAPIAPPAAAAAPAAAAGATAPAAPAEAPAP